MTQNEANAGTAALTQVAPGALARLQDAKPWTVADLADILAAPAAQVPEKQPLPEPVPPVTITDKLRKALRALPVCFGSVQPTERRRLEAAELTRITQEYQTIEAIKAQLAKRQDAIKEAVRIHQDFQAEDEGRTAIRVSGGVADGHYLAATPGAPFETAVDGMEDTWQQRYVKGSTSQEAKLLEELAAAGTISRAEYLGFTREVRVLDEERISTFIRKSPARGLAILASITKRNAPGASLYPPKK